MPITALGVVGPSAYQAAVANGFVGTEAEWLASLHGADGANGAAGTNVYVQPNDPGAVADGTFWIDTDDTTPDTSLNWGDIAGTLSNQTDLNTALAAKAPLASPALTGTPTAPTAANGTNTTQLATTAFVLANGGATSPLTTKGDLYGYSTASARVPVGTNGQSLVADSTQTTGLAYDYRRQPLGGALGTYISVATHGLGSISAQTVALVANTLYLAPIETPDTHTYTGVAIDVSAASASGNARLGIFTFDWTTATLVIDAGTVSTATTGTKNSPAISQALTPGWYWLGILPDTNFTASGFNPARAFGTSSLNSMNHQAKLTLAVAYAAFAGTYTGFASTFPPMPALGLKR